MIECFDIGGKGDRCAYLRLDNNINEDRAACYVKFQGVDKEHVCHCVEQRDKALLHQLTLR